LKYLDAESTFFLAVEEEKDMEIIESLQMKVDRLEALKAKSSSIIPSIGQVMNKIELFIQTNNGPRAKALAANRDMNGLRAFREVIAELKKYLEELSRKSDTFMGDNIIEKVDFCQNHCILALVNNTAYYFLYYLYLCRLMMMVIFR